MILRFSKITKFFFSMLILIGLSGMLFFPKGISLAPTIPSEKQVTWQEVLIPSAHADIKESDLAKITVERYGEIKKPQKPLKVDKLVERVGQLSTYMNYFFNPLIHWFTFKIGALLNNDHIIGGNMGAMLQNVWRVSRNLVNIAFVLILLYLALKHIFASEEGGNTDLKKLLPTFAIMLVAVNFSWLAGKLVLDAANVTANIAFALPAGVQGALGEQKINKLIPGKCAMDEKGRPNEFCAPTGKILYPYGSSYFVNLNADAGECDGIDKIYEKAYPSDKIDSQSKKVTETPPNKDHFLYGVSIFCWKTIQFDDYNQNTASYFLTYGMARVQELTRASVSDSDIAKLAIGTLFALVIQLVYLAAFISLFIALVIRIAMMWIFLAFSPFLVLIYFLQKNVQELKMPESINLETFTQWAFAPAKVGAVWSIGFIMITVGQTMTSKALATLNETGAVSSKFFQIETLFMGMNNIDQFLWLLMTIGIIWVGTFAVLTKLKVAEGIFNWINEKGRWVAKTAAESPTWVPIIPIYDHKTGEIIGKKSLRQISKIPGKWVETMRGDFAGDEKTMNIEKARQNLVNLDTAQRNRFNEIIKEIDRGNLGGAGRLAVKFMNDNGLDTQTIIDKESSVRDMLRHTNPLIQENLEKLMPVLMQGAKNAPPPPPAPTAAAPAAQAPPPPPQAGASEAAATSGTPGPATGGATPPGTATPPGGATP